MCFLYQLLILRIPSIIGAVHSSNFFISPFPREFDVPKESDVKLELHNNKRDLNDVWQIIDDLGDRAKSFPLVTADPKTESESR